ncbi:MAG: hypothetical protein IPN02_07600 [Candidatus Microthrix sp.]|uniref:Uncharacterized protein n=1 Tax=Candidatus Neomicrothrix subdominans TaxID=2954438 RepID=A0A936NCX7_9ACTN|nr:hypothetical protein [Candidatus Microthrix subdominans]MBK9296693.1 hypothetical protein [Candidatus Microthrix subdominans]
MRRISNRVAGLDVHRDSVTACVEIFDGVEVSVIKERFSTTVKGSVGWASGSRMPTLSWW